MKSKFKNDKYKHVRGASRLLRISCRQCDSVICHYQKDGHGGLFRLYLDRISNANTALEDKGLNCPNGHLVAVKIIYEKEDRPAFRLLPSAIMKKILET